MKKNRLWFGRFSLKVKRITEYDKYLNDLLDDTDPSHQDYEQLSKAAGRVRTMVREREEEEREADQEEEMDSIQDRFPHDDLQLKDTADKAQANKARGISLRRKSAPSAVVFRSVSGGRSRSSSVFLPQSTMGRKDDALSSLKQATDNSRRYIMEDPVELAMGMQTQDRYLFLLNDLLMVAKQKNASTYKLKTRVPLCDAWLSDCVDEVTELTRHLDRSFVIGWPTHNAVATFRDAVAKVRWLNKLTELIQEQRQQVEPKEISLKVVLRDGNKTCDLTVQKTQQAKDVVRDCWTKFNIPDSESKDYKLWLWSSKEGYYPLIGHETPFSIQVSHLREVGRARGAGGGAAEEGMTLEELNQLASQQPPSNLRWQFILKQKKTPKKHSLDEVSHKSMKKSKKSSPLLNIFKRTGREEKVNNNTPTGKLFCLPLASVWQSDDTPPKPIAEFLSVLHRDGPEVVGILRKSANVKHCKELRYSLDQGEPLEEEVSAVVAGALLKDYLRSLPDPLLTEALHDEWLQVACLPDEEQKVAHIKHLLSQMPAPNVGLLKHVVCALHRIQLRVQHNLMTSSNLSRCIAPSLLWHQHSMDVSGGAPAVEFMIDHCCQLFGPEVLLLLQDPTAKKASRPDSSGTDSDSYHSVLSIPETGNSDSIDSLVDRELFTAEGEGEEEEEEGRSGPPPTKSHLSPSNLSRDSGLTLSDTQLYDEECADHHHNNDPRGLAFSSRSPHHHRSAAGLHFGERDDEESDCYHQEHPPVPPPRKRGKRQGGSAGDTGGHAGRLDSGGGMRGRVKRHTLHGSLSSSRLLDQLSEDYSSSSAGIAGTKDSLRSTMTLPTFSSMSEVYGHMEREELREFNRSSDIGLLRKSASGAHLILDEETLSRKCSESSLSGSGGTMAGGGAVVFRQSSGVDSSPPHSPQSKYSFSSRDSVISDWSQGGGAMSRESSVTSAPQTPDTEYADRLPPWLPHLDVDYRAVGERRLAHSFNLNLSSVGTGAGDCGEDDEETAALSASVGALLPMNRKGAALQELPSSESPVSEVENQDFKPLSFGASGLNRQSLQIPAPSLSWRQEHRSLEAEDVLSPASSPQISITACAYSRSMDNLDEPEADEATPRASPNSSADMLPLEIAHGHGGLPVKQMSKYSHNLAKVSPPPRVLLQSLRSPRNGKDPAPLRASHDSDIVAQVQRAGFRTPREVQQGGGKVDVDGESQVSSETEGAAGVEGAACSSDQGFDAAKSMEAAINDTEYIPVKPKLTIIHREESILSNASSHSSASSVSSVSSAGMSSLSSLTLSTSPSSRSSSSSSGGSSNTLAGEQTRPSRPPEYEEAVKRSLLLKQQEIPPDDEAEAQAEASRKARHLFETSKQQYLQGHQEHKDVPQRAPMARKISDPGTTRNATLVGEQSRRAETEHPRSVSPDISAVRLTNNSLIGAQSQNANSKAPRQIYLESVQRYEQQQNKRVEASGGLTARTAEPASSTKMNRETDCKPSAEDNASEDMTGKRTVLFGETRVQLRAVGTSANNRTRVPKDARPRSMLDIPSSCSLHRSLSDSADRLNKLGLRSPPRQSEASGSERKDSDVEVRRPVGSAFSAAEPRKLQFPVRKTSDAVIYERRNGSESSNPPRPSVLTASCFYHPDDSLRSGRSSPAPSSRQDTSSTPRVSRTEGGAGPHVGRAGARPPRSESPANRTSRVVTSASSTQASSSVSGGADHTSSRVASDSSGVASADSKPKTKLGWSVKNLAKIYMADSNSGSEQSSRNPPRGVPAAAGARVAGPPPYQDPPPFRRLQDHSRLSTSSSSSNASCSTARSGSPSLPRNEGPQNSAVDCHGDEDLSQCSTRWAHARAASGATDQEAINPFTDISYV